MAALAAHASKVTAVAMRLFIIYLLLIRLNCYQRHAELCRLFFFSSLLGFLKTGIWSEANSGSNEISPSFLFVQPYCT